MSVIQDSGELGTERKCGFHNDIRALPLVHLGARNTRNRGRGSSVKYRERSQSIRKLFLIKRESTTLREFSARPYHKANSARPLFFGSSRREPLLHP